MSPLQDLHYFTISHQTNVPINTWSKITITAKNSNDFTIYSNIGSVTVRVDSAIGNITWMDPGNCGNYTSFGSYIVYEFQNCANGVLSLYIMDDTVDTVNVEVRGTNITSITDDDTEGDLFFYTAPVIIIHKTNVSPLGDIYPGDYIRYRVDYTNYGGPATNVVITDPVPNNSTYSLESINDGISLSDSAGNDAGYYDGTQIIYSPNGLAPSDGTLAAGETGSFYFTVQVNTTGPVPGSVTIPLDNTAQDGQIKNNGNTAGSSANTIMAGDFSGNSRYWYALQGFNLDAIPAGANITSATVGFYIINVTGNPNANGLNPYHVDHVDFDVTVNDGDHQPAIDIQTDFTSFDYPGNNQWFFYPCGAQVSNAFANPKAWNLDSSDQWFQVRYRCNAPSSDGNNNFEIVAADDAGNPGLHPYLIVHYLSPGSFTPDAITNTVSITGNFPSTNDTIVLPVVPSAAPILSVSKVISDISINGISVSAPLPGSTITYQVNWSNQGPGSALNMIVYDQLPADVIYSNITPTGWIEQYSYSALPDQSYGSADYDAIPPGIASNVRYVRWINASVPAGEAGSFTYTVIIK